MFSNAFVQSFIDDPTVRLIGVAWALDFLLGLYAGIKAGQFRLSYIADTLRNDLIGKVFPYYTIWAALHVSGVDWSLAGVDLVEESTGGLVIAALGGSIFNSLRDLGIGRSMPDQLAGPDPMAPTPPATMEVVP